MQKLLEQEFIVEVPTAKVNHDTPEWYLPLQAVFTPDRTTKVRLVFDASAKGQNAKSLNDHLEKGPNYINSLPNVLMAWRFDKIAYTGDMFNQVMIHPVDQVFHRFLWRSNDSEQPRVYQWMRLNFGDKPAPDIAAGSIKTLANASEVKYPEAAKELSRHVYVNEIGNKWNKTHDKISFKKNEIVADVRNLTKTDCLAQLWDPIGLVTPVTIELRIDLQELWSAGYSWDEILLNRFKRSGGRMFKPSINYSRTSLTES